MCRKDSDCVLAGDLLALVRSEAAPDSPGVAFSEGFSETWCSNAAAVADPTAKCDVLGRC